MKPGCIVKYIFLLTALMVAFRACNTALALGPLDIDYIKPGSEGEDVEQVQKILAEYGYFKGDVDGIYDNETTEAVKQLQKLLGVTADGKFGPITMAAYNNTFNSGKLVEPTTEFEQSNNTERLPLQGIIIGIDPGHQLAADYSLEALSPESGKTKIRMSSGSKGIKTGVEECRINLQISLKLRKFLEDSGAKVIMTRTTNDVSISNMERAILMNESNVDVWLRIHCDYSASRKAFGASLLLPSRSTNSGIYKQSVELGFSVLEAFCLETGSHIRSISRRGDQTAFNWSKAPVIALEMGYISNPEQDMQLNTVSYQEACARGIFKGLIDYFTLK